MVDAVDGMDTTAGEDESLLILPLREWRERRGWSVRELERRSGAHRNTIQRVEHDWSWGRPCEHETIFKLADALGIQWWQFEDDRLSRDLDPQEWLPPDEPEPDVPEERSAPLLDWMRARHLSISALTHTTGAQHAKRVQGKYGEREEVKWSSGVGFKLVADILNGEHLKTHSARVPASHRCMPTRLEIVRICRRLGVQPMEVREFRPLSPEKRAPIRLEAWERTRFEDLPPNRHPMAWRP